MNQNIEDNKSEPKQETIIKKEQEYPKILAMRQIRQYTTEGRKEEIQKIGEQIRNIRYRNCLARRDLSTILGIELETLAAIENGYGNARETKMILERINRLIP